MTSVYESVQEAADFLSIRVRVRPVAAMILGTGLGGIADRLQTSDIVAYRDIPGFPESTVESHGGNLVFGRMAGVPIVAMQGRFHYYEGYTLQQVTLPVRVMKELGAEFLFVNSAAGGLNPAFAAGDVMLVTDHLNLIGDNPLRGLADERLGERFPDMSLPYDGELIRITHEVAVELKTSLRSGVYASVAGPSLETRAETRMLRTLGADAVGMSTVPEVIVACQVGFRTMVLAAITNVNIPDAMEPISIERVIANAALAGEKMAPLIEGIVFRLPKPAK